VPECGDDPAAVDLASILAMVRRNAVTWQDVLARPDARRQPRPDVWSPLEYACHARDVFALFDARLHLMLDEDDPLFANWDQDETAVAARYWEQDPSLVAAEVVAAGDQVADSFAAVDGAQWQRPGRRSDGARFTVESFGRYFVHDWVHHAWDVDAA
jgi:DinB superfamily